MYRFFRFVFCISIIHSATCSAIAQESLVARVDHLVQPIIEKHSAEAYDKVLQRLAGTDNYPASFKLSLVETTFQQPWQGMAQLEQAGLDAIQSAQSDKQIANSIDLLGSLIEIEQTQIDADRQTPHSWQEARHFIREILKRSSRLREDAIRDLSQEEREFLFHRPSQLVLDFSVQTSCHEDRYESLRADLRFFELVSKKVDWAKLAAAAKTLALLTEEKWLNDFEELANQQPLLDTEFDWISGSLVWAEETEYGWLIVGGPGDNHYRLDQPVAALFDLGGNDSYEGMVAANNLEIGISLVIDMGGDDVYNSHTLGLATGRLGVGILLDIGGNDKLNLADGAGGTGFGGIGILQKRGGSGQFKGTRWVLGTAMGGIGLVLGGQGNDQYQADIYSIGVGGPLGIGAVIDLGGNDSYRCGFRYGSGYNQSDAPDAKPGDPNYQFEGWGLGMGLGRRFYPWLTAEQSEFRLAQLAGGIGMLIDIDGDDQYESSNFSLGCGYYFGAGLKLDVTGNDRYQTGRYGNGAGAHQAIGLAIDYDGSDEYRSSGPTYHGGCAWDCSVFMCIDGGIQNDRYDLMRTSGLGVADHGSLGIFADLGGDDHYSIQSGLGRGGSDSLGIFLDMSGDDHYDENSGRKNGQEIIGVEGRSLFIDR